MLKVQMLKPPRVKAEDLKQIVEMKVKRKKAMKRTKWGSKANH